VPCDHSLNKVTDSRRKDYGTSRRRECLKCGHRWTTIEVALLPEFEPNKNSSAYNELCKQITSEALIILADRLKHGGQARWTLDK